MKRFFAIVLAVVCCMALAVPALAQGMEPATPYFSHIQFYTGNMQINNGVAEVSGTLRISRGDACEIVATIEQDVDGSWEEVKTFTVYADSNSVSINKKWALYRGYNYRCVFQANAYQDGKLVESDESTTNEKWC